jgi:hypothetical protein
LGSESVWCFCEGACVLPRVVKLLSLWNQNRTELEAGVGLSPFTSKLRLSIWARRADGGQDCRGYSNANALVACSFKRVTVNVYKVIITTTSRCLQLRRVRAIKANVRPMSCLVESIIMVPSTLRGGIGIQPRRQVRYLVLMQVFYLNCVQMAKLLRISEAGNFMGSK